MVRSFIIRRVAIAVAKVCHIYLIRCLPTGREYVGSTVAPRLRWNTHKKFLNRKIHGNPKLQRAWNKYGEAQFEFRTVEQCSEIDREKRETSWIQDTGSAKYGFNLSGVEFSAYATMGMLGKRHSPESRAKMRAARLGVEPWNKGKRGVLSEEARRKISFSQIGHKKHLGKKHSTETKRKQSLAKMGKPLSPEHRIKISQRLQAFHLRKLHD